jgi:hypothetical protein
VAFLTRRLLGRQPNHVVPRYTSIHYRAKSWSKARRIVANIEFRLGELFPTVGFLVTNHSLPNERVFAFYNDRGTAEQHIKERKTVVKWTRLSCRTMKAMASWSLASIREKVVKIGAKFIVHARYSVFQMAEVAVLRDLFQRILDMIDNLRPREPAPC